MTADINPETDEVVDQISRTTAMRVAASEKAGMGRRTTADVISVLEDKHWMRGWWHGLWVGIPVGVILYKVYLAVCIALGY
jgi:hypothetical protein